MRSFFSYNIDDNYNLIALSGLDADDFEGCEFSCKFRAPDVFSKEERAKDLRNFVMVPSAIDALDLALPDNVQTPRFRLPIPVVREKRTNRAAQTNRIGEPKAAAKILNLAPRIMKITDDDRRRLEAQNLIKRNKWNERKSERRSRKRTSNDVWNGNSGQTK